MEFMNKCVRAFCNLPFARVKIGCDGEVRMCCHQWGYLGNLFDDPFEDIWFGQRAESIRDEIRFRLPAICGNVECELGSMTLNDFQVNGNGYPLELELDLHGSHCNFGGTDPNQERTCIMCPRSGPEFKDYIKKYPDRTEELVEKVRHIMPHLQALNILGIAEPFWKGKIFEILEQLDFSRHRDHLVLWVTTNGSLFNVTVQKRFLELVSRSLVHFSVDAATPETYSRIRRQNLFYTVCTNIGNWSEAIDHDRHKAKLHNNINELNAAEMPNMVVLAKALGIDEVCLLPTHDCGGSLEAIRPYLLNQKNFRLFKEAQQEAIRVAEEIGQKVSYHIPVAFTSGQLFALKMI